MDALIEAVRRRISSQAPELLDIFDTYAAEARVGRDWLESDLRRLRPGDEILEIGAGMLLLACQLKKEGFAVTALEPVADGFSHFTRLQQLTAGCAEEQGVLPPVMSVPAERLAENGRFAFAYSLNVMEHVADVEQVLTRVHAALKPGGSHRFVCPNYAFPYETHFRIPTFGSKRLTWKLMRRWIEHSRVPGAAGLWASLNWITVEKVRRSCRRRLNVTPYFDTGIIDIYVNRALHEPSFRSRHPLAGRALRIMRSSRLLVLLYRIPTRFLPVMDCRITKRTS